MARILTAVIIMITIITLGVLDQVNLHTTFDNLILKTTEIEELVLDEEYDTANIKSKELLEWWKCKRDILELTFPHDEIKDLVVLLAQLDGFLVSKQYDNVIYSCEFIQEDASNKVNILSFSLKNIL